MGLFSTKKTIMVASTVYNMAGDEANRPNFLKSTMFSATINPNSPYLGESLVSSHLDGPGMNQRALFRWAVANDYPGLPTYSISNAIVVDPDDITPFITIPSSPVGLELVMQEASLADGDYEVFAEQYMNTNFPSEIDTDWVAGYYSNDHTITIQRESGATVSFPAGDYDPNGRFIVANYYLIFPELVGTLDEGTKTEAVTSGLPSTSGFSLTSTTNTGIETYIQDQTRVITRTYSNGDPTVVDTDYPHIETDFNTILTVMEKTVYNGGDGDSPETSRTTTFRRVWEYREVYTSSSTHTEVNDLGGGVFETVVTNISGDFLRTVYDWQIDTQDTVFEQTYDGNKLFIYKIGTGNSTLDALNVSVGSAVTAEFFPIIPVRLNNRSITEPDHEDLYASSAKLYKKATKRQKFADLVAKVEENEDLDEIDYSYIQWGISLNTKDKYAKKYLYTFWKNLMPLSGVSSTYFDDFVADVATYEVRLAAWKAWRAAQADSGHIQFGTSRPTKPKFKSPKTTTLQFKTDHVQLQDFDNRISFSCIQEFTHSGLGKVDAKKGDFWIVKETPFTWKTRVGVTSSYGGPDGGPSYATTKTNTITIFSIYWQNDFDEYKQLKVYGALHQNFIYGGKFVSINSSEALDDTDESGFIIPLHYPSLKEAGLVSSTQLAVSNTYIIFNSYQIFKKKWYQRFFGMLFIVIVVVVAIALIAPAAVGGISGIFGTNAALGASLGLSGTSAIVAGAVANALAAIFISIALTVGSTAIFGAKWGAIIGSLLSFALTFGMAGGFNNLATLLQPSNLLSLSSALANGYQGFVQANIAEMGADMFKVGEEYQKEMDRIQDLMSELMGNDLAFNPMSLTDASKGNGSGTGRYLPESLDDFIQRTTLTGSDIVDLTLSMVNDFSDLSLTLPRT